MAVERGHPEFGRTTAELFEAFDPVPLATASIGQVHTARLNGRTVAVKVQRPNVDTDFLGDIRLMTAPNLSVTAKAVAEGIRDTFSTLDAVAA